MHIFEFMIIAVVSFWFGYFYGASLSKAEIQDVITECEAELPRDVRCVLSARVAEHIESSEGP